VEKAHARGIQLHAYINVYPVWDRCDGAPPFTNPTPFYYLLQQAHGTSDGKLRGLQWDTSDNVHCSGYQRASPASGFGDDHYLAVARDLATRYDIDGLHLDHIRYGGINVSCDPVSEAAAGVNCFGNPPAGFASYGNWQRAQVNGTVFKFYDRVTRDSGLWLSAAVWPLYYDYWNWGIRSGYSDYYQDSKAWLTNYDGNGQPYIDSISPMIYPANYSCPDDSFWTQGVWQTLVADFQASSDGRFVIPGIGTGYCNFSEIEARINMARQIGTAGHALFSYSSLVAHGYFDNLANGPYAIPAVVPEITWHN
jgi:uncharacterized lipoprotein YddW (UPF0748 family)